MRKQFPSRAAELKDDLDNKDGRSTHLNPDAKTERSLDEYVGKKPWIFETDSASGHANWLVIKEQALDNKGIDRKDFTHKDRYQTLREALIRQVESKKNELES